MNLTKKRLRKKSGIKSVYIVGFHVNKLQKQGSILSWTGLTPSQSPFPWGGREVVLITKWEYKGVSVKF